MYCMFRSNSFSCSSIKTVTPYYQLLTAIDTNFALKIIYFHQCSWAAAHEISQSKVTGTVKISNNTAYNDMLITLTTI